MISGARLSRRRTALWSLGVVVLAVATYANTLANGFVMDDHYNVVENGAIRRLAAVPQFFTNPLAHGARRDYDRQINQAYWRPLALTSYALDYSVWQLEPLGYHLTNVLLHAGVSLLVLLLLLHLGLAPPGAVAAGVLFALHPVHTEVVNLITYRTELLAAAFVLLALLVAVRWGQRADPWIPVLFACGLASKETAVTLPLWLLLLDFSGAVRPSSVPWSPKSIDLLGARPPGLVRRYLPLALVLLGYLLLRHLLLQSSAIDFFAELSAEQRLLSVAKIYYRYLQLLVFPWPLIPFYDWTVLAPASGWADWQALLGLLMMLLTLVGVVWLWRREPLASLGLAWWAVGLVPTMHLVALPVGAAERFLYLPSLGICLLTGVAVQRCWQRVGGRAILGLALVAMAALLGLVTVQRNRHWRTDMSLQTRAALDYPGSFSAHYNLGKLYLEQGQLEQAVRSLTRANAILPNIPANVVRLADALILSCRPTAALAVLDSAVSELGATPQFGQLRHKAERLGQGGCRRPRDLDPGSLGRAHRR